MVVDDGVSESEAEDVAVNERVTVFVKDDVGDVDVVRVYVGEDVQVPDGEVDDVTELVFVGEDVGAVVTVVLDVPDAVAEVEVEALKDTDVVMDDVIVGEREADAAAVDVDVKVAVCDADEERVVEADDDVVVLNDAVVVDERDGVTVGDVEGVELGDGGAVVLPVSVPVTVTELVAVPVVVADLVAVGLTVALTVSDAEGVGGVQLLRVNVPLIVRSLSPTTSVSFVPTT